MISVIIPVWNGENYLAEAIQSVLEQDYPEKEILVVNDGSTDGTVDVIRQFGSSVICLSQENRGLGAARNLGIAKGKGSYFAFLDHDDVWEKGKLSKQMEQICLEKEEDPLIFTHVRQFICPSLSVEEQRRLIVNEEAMAGYIAGTMLISRKRLDEVGPFIERKQVGEYVDWFLRAKERHLPMRMLSQVFFRRRVHQSNMGRLGGIYNQNEYLKILKASLERRRALSLSKIYVDKGGENRL